MRVFTASAALALLTISSSFVAAAPPSAKNSKTTRPKAPHAKSFGPPAKSFGKTPAKSFGPPAKSFGPPPKPFGKTPAKGFSHSEHSCPPNHFYYRERSSCLRRGGPVQVPHPPSGKTCPREYYWHYQQGCCVPKHESHPPPLCPQGWEWENWHCKKRQTPVHHSPPPPPHPSPRPGKGKYGKQPAKQHGKQHGKNGEFAEKVKRGLEVPLQEECGAQGYYTCPAVVDGVATLDMECIDTLSDLKSCGGCASLGHGQNCDSIEYSLASSCYGGVCFVLGCKEGFEPSDDNSSCIKTE